MREIGSGGSAAIGLAVHTGWAAAVVVAGPPPRVLIRRTIELADDVHDARFIYHVAAENLGRAAEIVSRAAAIARDRAAASLRQLVGELPEYALVVAIPRPKRTLPPMSTILGSHTLIHSAEGELFRQAVADGAAASGLRLIVVQAGKTPSVGKIGPPWGKDQKDAAALAWAALSK